MELTLHHCDGEKMLSDGVHGYSQENFLEWKDRLWLEFTGCEFMEVGWIRNCETGRFVYLEDGILFQPIGCREWEVKKHQTKRETP